MSSPDLIPMDNLIQELKIQFQQHALKTSRIEMFRYWRIKKHINQENTINLHILLIFNLCL